MAKIPVGRGIISGKGTLYSGKTPIIFPGSYGVEFGNYCAIGPGLTVMGINHDYNYPALQYTFYKKMFNSSHPGVKNNTKTYCKGKVIIGNDVWFGNNVSIMSGVKIGDGCIIGLGSIVTKDLEPYTICAGVPCKKIKNRFSDEIISFLLKLKWWDWNDAKIRRNRDFFSTSLENITVEQLKNIIKD